MAEQKDNKKPAIPPPNLSELFGEKAFLQADANAVFAKSAPTPKEDKKRLFSPPSSFFRSLGSTATLVYLLILTAMLIYVIRRPQTVSIISAAETPFAAPTMPATPVQTADWFSRANAADPTPQMILDYLRLSKADADALDGALSLQTAERFYHNKQFYRAAYVYARLRQRLETRQPSQQALADWLSLQMALSLQKTQEQPLLAELFDQALASRSPVVRALANYNLAFIQNHNCNFLSAYQRAYAALALLKSVELHLPPTVESDCYFVALESLTRYLLSNSSASAQLPASVWSDQLPVHSPAISDQEQLTAMLSEGMDELVGAALAPRMVYLPHQPAGQQWSAMAWDAPLREILKRYATQAGIDLDLTALNGPIGDRKVSAYFPQTDRYWLVETLVGSAGLVWQLEGSTGRTLDAAGFADLAQWRDQLAQYAISCWQKFMLRYRGDHRFANAHYALGLLHSLLGQSALALGEYKLLNTQFSNHPLAPYGLLNASRIRTQINDYKGAQADLNELLIRYPNFKQMDAALLDLAEATLRSGQPAQASEMFRRIYYLNVADAAKRRALAGLGEAAFVQKDYPNTIKWLDELSRQPNAQKELFWPSCCLMLGRAYYETGQFSRAAETLRAALSPRLEAGQYLPIALRLAQSELRRQNDLAALSLLESIPEQKLNQEQSVELLLARSQTYRAMGLPTTAISLLRRRMEFVAESDLRALIGLELAECYVQNNEPVAARKELVEAMPSLPTGEKTFRAALLLAQIAADEKRFAQAEAYCLEALRLGVSDPEQKQAFYQMLGKIYQAQNALEKAALAYAGIIDQMEAQ